VYIADRGRSPLDGVLEDERDALPGFHTTVRQHGRDSVGEVRKFTVREVHALHALRGDRPEQRLVPKARDAGLNHLVEGSWVVA
jgi:hypothetical protein